MLLNTTRHTSTAIHPSHSPHSHPQALTLQRSRVGGVWGVWGWGGILLHHRETCSPPSPHRLQDPRMKVLGFWCSLAQLTQTLQPLNLVPVIKTFPVNKIGLNKNFFCHEYKYLNRINSLFFIIRKWKSTLSPVFLNPNSHPHTPEVLLAPGCCSLKEIHQDSV